MKTIKILFVFFIIIFFQINVNSQIIVQRQKLEINNVRAYFQNTGVFDQNSTSGINAGFEWPKSSNKYAIFTGGLTVAAYLNGILSSASCSYKGELAPGYCQNGVPVTNSNFKIYRVSKGDDNSNPDYANWYLMVPWGAPYNDVNHNGVFDQGIDIPGVKNSGQTIFMCLTDGFISTHDSTEGFFGGKPPLYAEFHITVWAYITPGLEDVQFIKFEIINKAAAPWTRTYMTLFSDPDLGDENDDYIVCDSLRNMGICYNGDNDDPIYGIAPPAVAIKLLKGPIINSNQTGLTSFNFLITTGDSTNYCEWNTQLYPRGRYLQMQGFKLDSTAYLNPTFSPPRKTKFLFTGDPETHVGWTLGWIKNCGGDSTGPNVLNDFGDLRMNMNLGADNFTMYPNDTQRIYFAQFIARGSSNLQSATKIKGYADFIQNFFDNGFDVSISGTVKFADNNQPVNNNGYVKAIKLDKSNGNIITLDSTGILPDGTYSLISVPIDSVYIGAYPNSTSTPDFVPGYYPSALNWQNATVLFPTGNMNNINISVYRVTNSTTGNSINGRIFKLADGGLKDAYIYAKSGNNFVKFAASDNLGVYHLLSLPAGSLKIIVHRLGFSSDSTTVNLTKTLDSVNFHLNQQYVGISNYGNNIPDKFTLFQNYPNPFNPITKMKFEISPLSRGVGEARGVLTTLKVFDVLGKEIATLINEKLSPGVYEVEFKGENLPSGVYFYRLVAGDFTAVRKMILIK